MGSEGDNEQRRMREDDAADPRSAFDRPDYRYTGYSDPLRQLRHDFAFLCQTYGAGFDDDPATIPEADRESFVRMRDQIRAHEAERGEVWPQERSAPDRAEVPGSSERLTGRACRKCARPLLEGAKFCVGCGTRIENNEG